MTGFGTDQYRLARREIERALGQHQNFVDRLSLYLDEVIDNNQTKKSVDLSMQELELVDGRLRSAQESLSNAAFHLLQLARIE